MGALDKWYVFGRDPGFDEGMRACYAGNTEEAVRSLTSFINQKPSDLTLVRLAKLYLAECYAKQGSLKEEGGDLDGSLEAYQLAMEHQPGFADTRVHAARVLMHLQRTQEALSMVAQALTINPQYVSAHILKAIGHYQAEDCDATMNAVIDAIAIQPSLDNAMYQAFAELHNAGKNEKAIEHLWKLLDESESNSTKWSLSQASGLAGEGQHESACDLYLKLIETVPGYADVRCRYGESLLELGQLEAAQEQFEAALDINPRYADAMAALGVLALKRSDKASAREAFVKVLEWNPNHAVASEQLRHLAR